MGQQGCGLSLRAKNPRWGREGQTWPWSPGLQMDFVTAPRYPAAGVGHLLSVLLLWGWKGWEKYMSGRRGHARSQGTLQNAKNWLLNTFCSGFFYTAAFFFISSWNKDGRNKPRRISSPLSSVGKLPLCKWIGFIWMLPISPARAKRS